MTAETQSASTDTGLAPAPLETQGGDDFTSLLQNEGAQDTSKSNTGTETSVQDPTKPAQTLSKPAPKEGDVKSVGSPGGTTQAAPAGTQTSGLDPKMIEEIVAASTRGVQKATAESAQATAQQRKDAKEMSPQEFAQKYQIRTATVDDLKALLAEDPNKAVQVLNDLLIANTRTAVLMAKDVLDAQLAKEREQYVPHVKEWTRFQAEQAEAKRVATFYSQYPDLANEKEIVEEMKNSLMTKVNTGLVRFETEAQVFEAVAAASRKLVARMNTQASTAAGGKAQQTSGSTTASTRQMATLSSAGRSGTGTAAPKDAVDEVFGADAR